MNQFKCYLFIILILTVVFNIVYANEENSAICDLLRRGSIDELRNECKSRGIAFHGNELELKRRLLEDEKKKSLASFESKKKSIENSDILLDHSDFIEYREVENGEELIVLKGNVEIEYNDKRIFADEVSINTSSGIITGNGKIVFIDRKKKYFAERFFYSTDSDEGLFFNAKSSIKKFIYTGKLVRKLKKGDKFVVEDAKLSTCNIKYPHYHIQANELSYYDSNYLLIKNASFCYGQDVLFSLPYYYKNLKEPELKSSLCFRERSGLVVQNTYYPLKADEKELVLKGDLYERLGEYIGVDYKSEYESGKTELNLSSAISKNVYYYDNVTENWSPLGPVDAEVYKINRSFRYNAEVYQKLSFGAKFKNDTELWLYWAKDPYYQYDFERRSEKFDIFKLIEQAEYDYPRKSPGYTWYLNNLSQFNDYSLLIANSLRFEPQRNEDEETVYLPDYYEYRAYSASLPSITFTQSKTFLNSLEYQGYANYSHIYYFDENEAISSELHKTDTYGRFQNEYAISNYIHYSPTLELGVGYQQHVDPDSLSVVDDKEKTLVYGDMANGFLFGGETFNINLSHRIKYKLFGPEDYYDYWRFRIHNLSFKQELNFKRISQGLETSYDLRLIYNWEKDSYEQFKFNKSHFTPLISSVTYIPFSGLTLDDRLVYDIKASRLSVNNFVLNYQSKDIYLSNIISKCSIDWNIYWSHNFSDPFLDSLGSNFYAGFDLKRYLTIYFSVYSKNDNMWKYFSKISEEEGTEKINPIVDLLKSFNFFNVEDRKSSNFKMKSISFGFIHDLHDWQLVFDYTGKRVISYDASRYIWDNTFSISIGLKEVKDVNIHTQFRENK